VARSAWRKSTALWLGLLATAPGCFLVPSAAGMAVASTSNGPAGGSAAQPAGASVEPPPAAPAPAAEPPPPPEPPEIDIAPPSKALPDLRLSIGGRHQGGEAPIALAQLTRAMTPDDVDAVFPGAKRISRYGLSKVRVKQPPGVATIEFMFLGGRLHSSTLAYKTSLTTAAFGEYFFRVVKNKYGGSNDEIFTYALPSGVLVQATKSIDHYEISYVPPRI